MFSRLLTSYEFFYFKHLLACLVMITSAGTKDVAAADQPPPDTCYQYHGGEHAISPTYTFTTLDKSSIDREHFAWWELSRNYPSEDFRQTLGDNHFEVRMEQGKKWTIELKKFGPNPVEHGQYVVSLHDASVDESMSEIRSFYISNLDSCNFYAHQWSDFIYVVKVKMFRYR